MMTDGKHEDPAPGAEDDAALWRLLERAKRPGPVSPYFARRVLREVAALEEDRPAVAQAPGWLTRLWRTWHGQARGVFAGALAAVALLAVGVRVSPLRWSAPAGPVGARVELTTATTEPAGSESSAGAESQVAAAETPVAAQDVEIIADLDNLLSNEESRLWTDEDTTVRY